MDDYVFNLVFMQCAEYVNDPVASVEDSLDGWELKHELYGFSHSSFTLCFFRPSFMT